MIMKTQKLLWKTLFAKQKSGVSGVFRDLGLLVLPQNVLAYLCNSAVKWLQVIPCIVF